MNTYNRGWIGVDLDGTLAKYDQWQGPDHIGVPIPKMVNRVIKWMNNPNGPLVKIVTARVSPTNPDADVARFYINKWLEKHILSKLPPLEDKRMSRRIPITHEKDFAMIELWDDRCVQVIPNTGERADGRQD